MPSYHPLAYYRASILCALVYNRTLIPVHDQHHQRHHKSHRTIDKQNGLCQSRFAFLKPLFFAFFPAERTYHRDTGQDLSWADQGSDGRSDPAAFNFGHSNLKRTILESGLLLLRCPGSMSLMHLCANHFRTLPIPRIGV